MSKNGIHVSRRTFLVVMSCFALALVFSAGTIPVVFLRSTAASSPKFSTAINLSNDANKAQEPTVSNNGQNVYVAWTEASKGIYFRESSNGGSTWTPATTSAGLRLSTKGGTAQFPVMFTEYQSVNSGDVYVAWAQTVTQANGSKILQIFVAASTNNGVSFTTTQLSHNSTNSQNTPAIAAYGSDVYVAWFSAKLSYSSPGGIYVSSSSNNGQTWSSPTDIYPLSTNGEAEIVATTGNNVYVMMDQSNFVYSHNSGATWSKYVALYNYTYVSGSVNYAREPWVAGWGNLVYTAWEANSTTGGVGYQDYGRVSTDGGVTWGPLQTVSGAVKDSWEPEDVAYGSNAFTTFHSLGTQGVYMTSATGVTTESPKWSTPVEVNSGMSGTSSYGHVASSDGVNVYVLWGQVKSGSVWNAYVSYSVNSGSSWSSPIDISNNSAGVAAGNQDVTLFALSSNGVHCFAAWTYTSGSTSQIYFAYS
jgi:hypothetical protein